MKFFNLFLILVVIISIIACSKTPLQNEVAVKVDQAAKIQAYPLGEFDFYLTSPADYYGCAIGENVSLQWSAPSPYCTAFQYYEVFINEASNGKLYNLNSRSKTVVFNNFGTYYWYVKTFYGYQPPYSSNISNNCWNIVCEINKQIFGPNPISSRSGQQWYINTSSASTFIKTWKVYNSLGQLVFSVTADKLSINHFPSFIASGTYFIECSAQSSRGRTYQCYPFQLTITW